MANKTVVQHIPRSFSGQSYVHPSSQIELDFADKTGGGTSITEPYIDGWSAIRNKYLSVGYDAKTVEILLQSWREGTQKCYKSSLRKWFLYCARFNIDSLNPSLTQVLKFFSTLQTNGASYRQLCATRSALSMLLTSAKSTHSWGSLPIVKRYMKGLFELSPVMPKVYFVWDVHTVFSYMRSFPSPSGQSLKMLSQNLALLLGLLSGGQRCQTIHQVQVPDLKIMGGLLYIPVLRKIKQTRPGKHMAPLRFRPYCDENLCIVTLLTEYLKVSATSRRTPHLFLSYTKPHSAVGKETISRWVKAVLKNAGIDITSFSSHSSRAAATSKAHLKGIALSKIIKYAGWSNEQTFARFYQKEVVSEDTFQDLILH